MKPFLKWAGGKQRIINHILSVLPSGKRLVEPFVGGGAVFLNTQYPAYLLADNNSDLINLYIFLKEEGESFIQQCYEFFCEQNNKKERYYQLRALFNASEDRRLRAKLFVYFNRHGYNGLCRYNSKGKFNVPFGQYIRPFFPRQAMYDFHSNAKSVEFVYADFMSTLERVKQGDVVYCDPPYVPLSKTAMFTAYSSTNFGENEQLALADAAERLANKGIPVIISNHNTEFTRHAYRHAKIITFDVARCISRDGLNRGNAKELLAVFDG